LSGRERRFIADVNHQISKEIAKPNSLIGLENLTGIRDRTQSKSGKKASEKQRKANRNKALWSFAELHGYIDYKANLIGSLATKVPAHYTSGSCPKCGHTSKANRPNKGLMFRCECCDNELHADAGWGTKYCIKNVARSARLDEHGELVSILAMCRAMKLKLISCKGFQNCGGA
jgi:IS605 OrfB family transposase